MNGIGGLIDASYDLVNDLLLPIAFALCMLYFFWGVAKYIRADAGGEKALEEGKRTMVWGVVGLFVAFSIWGIIIFIRKELNINPIDSINEVGGDTPSNSSSIEYGDVVDF